MQPADALMHQRAPKDKDHGPLVLVVDGTSVDRWVTVQLNAEAAKPNGGDLRVLGEESSPKKRAPNCLGGAWPAVGLLSRQSEVGCCAGCHFGMVSK